MSKCIKNVSERMKSRLEDWKRLEQMKVEESEWKKIRVGESWSQSGPGFSC